MFLNISIAYCSRYDFWYNVLIFTMYWRKNNDRVYKLFWSKRWITFFFIFTLQCFWNQCNQNFSPCESLHYNVNQILYCTDLRQMIDLCFFWHFYANHCQIIYINLVVQWRTCNSALLIFHIPMIYVPLYRSLWGIIMSINQALTSEMIYNLRNVLCFG